MFRQRRSSCYSATLPHTWPVLMVVLAKLPPAAMVAVHKQQAQGVKCQPGQTASFVPPIGRVEYQCMGGRVLRQPQFYGDRSEIVILEKIADEPPRAVANQDRSGVANFLQPGRQVRRLADHSSLLGFTRTKHIADNNKPGGDAYPAGERAGAALEQTNSLNQHQACANRMLGVVFVRLRVAEIGEHPVTHVFGYKSPFRGDRVGDGTVIRA
jgi:hypothetical protein